MTASDIQTHRPRPAGRLRPLAALGSALTHIAATSPRMRRMQAIAEMSADDLARHGLTREQAVRRAMGAYAFL